MKKGIIFCTMLFCINGAFADQSKTQIRIMCDIDSLTAQEQQTECPKLIEKVLKRMGCGGQVATCRATSPGSPHSGEVCNVINSQCKEPVIQEETHYKPTCKNYASSKYFRDYDDQTNYNSPLRLEKIYDMGVNVEFVCL